MPVTGYGVAVAVAVAAVVLAVIARTGYHAPMPPAGDWAAIGTRLQVCETLAVFCWLFYKLGSQRIVLRAASMEVIGFAFTSVVARNEVADVVQLRDCMAIVLADGTRLRPAMFCSDGIAVFRNAMSRVTIRAAILAWKQGALLPGPAAARGLREYLRHCAGACEPMTCGSLQALPASPPSWRSWRPPGGDLPRLPRR